MEFLTVLLHRMPMPPVIPYARGHQIRKHLSNALNFACQIVSNPFFEMSSRYRFLARQSHLNCIRRTITKTPGAVRAAGVAGERHQRVGHGQQRNQHQNRSVEVRSSDFSAERGAMSQRRLRYGRAAFLLWSVLHIFDILRPLFWGLQQVKKVRRLFVVFSISTATHYVTIHINSSLQIILN